MAVHRLKIKRLNAVHLVDKGAAIGSRVLIFKRRDADDSATEINMPLDQAKLATAISTAVAKAIGDVFQKEETQTAEQMLNEALEAHVKDESARAAIKAAIAAMYQATPPKPEVTEVTEPVEPAKAEGDVVKPGDETPKAEPKPEEEVAAAKKLEKTLSALPEEVRAVIKAELDARVEKSASTEARLNAAEEEIAKSRAVKELDEQVEIAKQFKHIPGDVNERGAALLALKKSNEKAYAKQLASFKATDALILKGLKSNTGTSRFEGDDAVDGDDTPAHEQLEALAKTLIKNIVEKGEKKISDAEAYSRVAAANPELKARASREVR